MNHNSFSPDFKGEYISLLQRQKGHPQLPFCKQNGCLQILLASSFPQVHQDQHSITCTYSRKYLVIMTCTFSRKSEICSHTCLIFFSLNRFSLCLPDRILSRNSRELTVNLFIFYFSYIIFFLHYIPIVLYFQAFVNIKKNQQVKTSLIVRQVRY